MAKNKLAKFAEMETLENVFQPTHEEVFRTDYKLKGKWGEQVFGNDHPIVLEVGCGKGEYSWDWANFIPRRISSDWTSREPACGQVQKRQKKKG